VLVLDWEIQHPDPVGWCHAWLSRCYARTGVRPWIYLNMATATRGAWGDVASAGFPLWLARYDGKTEFPGIPYWGTPVAKQYSDAGQVPGINGKVDLDCFNGDLGMFRRLGSNPATVNRPRHRTGNAAIAGIRDEGQSESEKPSRIHSCIRMESAGRRPRDRKLSRSNR
jgi:hypothetical protein